MTLAPAAREEEVERGVGVRGRRGLMTCGLWAVGLVFLEVPGVGVSKNHTTK